MIQMIQRLNGEHVEVEVNHPLAFDGIPDARLDLYRIEDELKRRRAIVGVAEALRRLDALEPLSPDATVRELLALLQNA